MDLLHDYAQQRFIIRFLLALAVVFAALIGSRLALTFAGKWVTHRGLLPKDYPLKKNFYRILLGIFVPFVGHLTLPLFDLPEKLEGHLAQAFQILLILGITGLVLRISKLAESALIHAYEKDGHDIMRARRMRTQLVFIHRLLAAAIITVGFSAVLLTFDGARRFGASLLASAGVASVVVGFAAQRSLSNLIAGFQIAFTQPVRIDDVVVVEKETGRVEEITLTYVVVRLWDFRRLILPITYLVEKPFENWTRNSTDLLGAITIPVDFHMPVEAIRTQLHKILQECELWNRQVCTLQVNHLTDRGMELRAVVSARNHSELSDLRAYVRESLVEFIQKEHPECFPKVRTEGLAPAAPDEA